MHPHYLTILLGTAGSWFILDVTFYGNSECISPYSRSQLRLCLVCCEGLFSGDVTQAIGAADSPQDEAVTNFYINLLAMPG